MDIIKKLEIKIVIIIFFSILVITPAVAWWPLTHYYINSQAEPEFGGIFNHYGTAPDIFTMPYNKLYYVRAHSPYPRTVENQIEKPDYPKLDYINENNFAYIMKIVAKYPSSKKARALGWGAHIVADWVAHKYLKIVDKMLTLDFVKHLFTELSTGLYCFYKKGIIILSWKIYPKLVWKGFVN